MPKNDFSDFYFFNKKEKNQKHWKLFASQENVAWFEVQDFKEFLVENKGVWWSLHRGGLF